MSKRGASEQITRENLGDFDADEEPGKVTQALASVLAKRKILKPRGKTTSGVASGNGGGSRYSFGANKSGASASSQEKKDGGDDKSEKIKALNEKFIDILKKSNSLGTVADFRDTAKKYIEFYDKIEAEETLESSSGMGVDAKTPEVSAKAQNVKSDSEEEDDNTDIKIQGPQFTLSKKPEAKKSPFNFGPKPEKKKDDSDSDSDIEIKGPTFSFNKPIKDSVFKFDPPTKKESSGVENNKPSFNFGGNNLINNSNAPPKPDAGENGSKHVFPFASSSNNDTSKPNFSFGSTSNKETPTPVSVFGTSETKAEVKPGFSFKPSSDTNQSKPTFSFGSNNKDDSKPPFSFGSTNQNEPTNTEPQESSDVKSSTDTPVFSLGAFGKSNDQQSNSTLGAFSNQKCDEPQAQKSPFSFGSTNTGDSKPAFFFGNVKATNSEDSANDVNKQSAFNFKFKPSDSFSEKPTFSFTPTNASQGEVNMTEKKEDAESVEPSNEETGGNFEPVASLSSQQIESQTGEEDEEALFTKRTKLMLFNPSNKEEPYSTKGVGELKILKNKSTNRSRILVRADGGFRVLLNTVLCKDISYTAIGNGSMVRVPTVNPSDSSIETFVLKVKTPADGEALLKVINNSKTQ